MKSNVRNRNILISFCILIALPIALMCLFGYLLSLLNGKAMESSALQAGITKLIGFGGLALIYWLIIGARRFWGQLRIADEELKAALAAPSAPAAVRQKRERKKMSLAVRKWISVTATTMLILVTAALAGMALTNPSYEEFKAFTPERNSSLHYAEWKNVHNYLLWSVYQKDVFGREDQEDDFKPISSQQYRGMLLNFTPLEQ